MTNASPYVQTVQAFRLRCNQEYPSANPPLSRHTPEIMCGDLRFAILLEQLYNMLTVEEPLKQEAPY